MRDATDELIRRKLCQQNLPAFALRTDVPGLPVRERVFSVAELGEAHRYLPRHHAVLYGALQATMNEVNGRLLVAMPPGSAKSTCANVAIAWDMARPKPAHRSHDARIVHVSYSDRMAHKQSGRIRDLCKAPSYSRIFDGDPQLQGEAKDEWGLTTGAELISAGVLAGISGFRATGILIDDPVKNRKEADSPTIQQNTLDEYQDTILSRLLPGGYVVVITTRWSERDLAGSILGPDYRGESGLWRATDGLDWRVLNVPALCERDDDPIGRSLGEYLWPEWFTAAHWQAFDRKTTREERRRWYALYQQRPTAEGAGVVRRDDFRFYEPGELPASLRLFGASDYATTPGGNDYTEHGVMGLDDDNVVWLVDWWSKQSATDEGIEAFCDLLARYAPRVFLWANEGGPIDKAIGPAINRAMRERNVFVKRVTLPAIRSKETRLLSFVARVQAHAVRLPRTDWAEELIAQILELPAGRFDDKADVASLLGRLVDAYVVRSDELPDTPTPRRTRSHKPFTKAWLEYDAYAAADAVCYR